MHSILAILLLFIVPGGETGPETDPVPDRRDAKPILEMLLPLQEASLEPLLQQLIRHSILVARADHLRGWVYTRGSVGIVADYEICLVSLDQSQKTLVQALFDPIARWDGSIQVHVGSATSVMDDAEFTLMMITEIAIREY